MNDFFQELREQSTKHTNKFGYGKSKREYFLISYQQMKAEIRKKCQK